MDNATRLGLLAESLGLSQELESYTTQILGRALRIGEARARVLTDVMSQPAVFAVLQELASRNDAATFEARSLKAWLKTAQKGNESRNRLIHANWVATGMGAAQATTVPSVPSPAVDALRADIDSMSAAVQGALALLTVPALGLSRKPQTPVAEPKSRPRKTPAKQPISKPRKQTPASPPAPKRPGKQTTPKARKQTPSNPPTAQKKRRVAE